MPAAAEFPDDEPAEPTPQPVAISAAERRRYEWRARNPGTEAIYLEALLSGSFDRFCAMTDEMQRQADAGERFSMEAHAERSHLFRRLCAAHRQHATHQ